MCRGFTLIELMAVVIIMAIVITIGVASLPRISKQLAVGRAGQQVLNAIEYARQLAMTQRTKSVFAFKDTSIAVGYHNNYYCSRAASGQGETWLRDRTYQYDGRNSVLPSGAVFLYPRGGNDAGPNVAGWGNNYQVNWIGIGYDTLMTPNNIVVYQADAFYSEYAKCYLIRFDQFGTPDITTTLILTESSSGMRGQWAPMPDFNSSNRFYIALTKGSRELRSWRN